MNKYQELLNRVELMNQLQKDIVVLREEVFEDVKANEGKVENEFGTFLTVRTKNWTYPKTVTEKEEIAKRKILKIQEAVFNIKAKSQKAGSATFEEFENLRVIPAKKIK